MRLILTQRTEMEHFMDAYKQYANFKGRANREKYWMFFLFYILAYIALSIVDAVIGTGGLLGGVFALGSLVPSLAIAARRLHDTDKSGWWQLLVLIPLIGAIVLIVFYASKGTVGENKFGADPLASTL